MKMLAALALSLVLSGSAVAQEAVSTALATACPVPEIPAVERPVKPVRPAVPSCVNEARGTHTCNTRALNAFEAANREYQQAFNAYVAQVNSYLQKLQAYTRLAITYSECERDVVMPTNIING
ncbi:MAG: hypothetical protein ACOH1E_10420 [Brevundimonas sp.]